MLKQAWYVYKLEETGADVYPTISIIIRNSVDFYDYGLNYTVVVESSK